MTRTTLLLTLVLLGGALAGCATDDENENAAPTPTPTPSTTPAPTPTTSTVPVPTIMTPTLPTPSGNLTNGTKGVTVHPLPTNLTAGENATVCWHVNGTGPVPHTALHYDNTSHPSSTSFQDYKGGAIYPGNATAADPAGYTLPGDFCANLMVPATGTLYFRAHVLVPNVRNELSEEHALRANGTSST